MCSGLRTQFGLINDGTTFGLALLVIVVATGECALYCSVCCVAVVVATGEALSKILLKLINFFLGPALWTSR